MGRGRAKAKQTKVARELKYYSPDPDLGALERELGAKASQETDESTADDQGDDDYGDYARWASGDR